MLNWALGFLTISLAIGIIGGIAFYKLGKNGLRSAVLILSVLAASQFLVWLLTEKFGIIDGSAFMIDGESAYAVNGKSAYHIFAVSLAFAVIGILLLINTIRVKQRNKIYWLTAISFGIVLFLHISLVVGFPYTDEPGNAELNSDGSRLARILQYTLQYFSLDAGYADIVKIGEIVFGGTGFVKVFHIIAGVMTVLAPIIGGFAIFNILGHFFPKIRLWLSTKPVKYVFSELNEYSIETAESIYRKREKLRTDKHFRKKFIIDRGKEEYKQIIKSVIIFTDVYTKKESEQSSELLKRAKDIDAICIKDDVLNLKIYWLFGNLMNIFRTYVSRKVVYFLVDKKDFDINQGEENNLQTAVSLFTVDPKRMMWAKTRARQLWTKTRNMEMYVFTRNENADSIIGNARNKWEKESLSKYRKNFDVFEQVDTKITDKLTVNKDAIIKVLSGKDNDIQEFENEIKEINKLFKTDETTVTADETTDPADETGTSAGTNSSDDRLNYMIDNLINFPKIRKNCKNVSDLENSFYKYIELANKLIKKVDEKSEFIDIDKVKKQMQKKKKLTQKLVNKAMKKIKTAYSEKVIKKQKENDNNELNKSINDLRECCKKEYGKKAEKLKTELFNIAINNDNLYDALRSVNDALSRIGPDISVGYKEKVTAVFKCINEYKNLIYNLLDGDKNTVSGNKSAVPLYIALKNNGDEKYRTDKLTVLIVGSGRIAKEFLKTAYWCGQMLNNESSEPTKLRIGVLSKEANNAESRLKFEMPEVFDIDICNYKKDVRSYCEFEFKQAEFGTFEFETEFKKFFTGETWSEREIAASENSGTAVNDDITTERTAKSGDSGKNIGIDFDYVLVALGSDEVNIRAADWIKREIKSVNIDRKIPVNYVIENADLCESLHEHDGDKQVLVNPFGSLRERFEFDNICMSDLERRAMIANCAYGYDSGREAFMLDSYSRDSSMAVAIHNAYKRLSVADDDSDYENKICWLEHRRWCAYMRSLGYRPHTQKEFVDFALIKDDDNKIHNIKHKNKELKLHLCVIESDPQIIDRSIMKEVTGNDAIEKGLRDLLDNALPDPNASIKSLLDNAKQIIKNYEQDAELDYLDVISILTSIFKENKDDKTFNDFKDNDVAISKSLKKDGLCKELLSNISTYEKEIEIANKIIDLYKEDMLETHNKYDVNVIKIVKERNGSYNTSYFILIGEQNGYDIVLWQTTKIDSDKADKMTVIEKDASLALGNIIDTQIKKKSVKNFLIVYAEKNIGIIGVKRGASAKVYDRINDDPSDYTVSIGNYDNCQKILKIIP